MKVGELIERLKEYDNELKVMVYTEDEIITQGPTPGPFFDIVLVGAADVETHRDDDGSVKFHFERSDTSRTIVSIEVTTDF